MNYRRNNALAVTFCAGLAVLAGCSDRAAEARKEAETHAELQEFMDTRASRHAPLIAAKLNINAEAVRAILVQRARAKLDFTAFEQSGKLKDFVRPREDASTFDSIGLPHGLAAQQVAQILYDAAVLDCEENSHGD